MPRPPPLTIILVVLGLAGLRTAGDELLYRYECDVVPYDPSAGWLDGLCEYPCSESLADGHFILEWPFAGDLANYHYWIARPPPPCGSSGASARTILLVRIRTRAMVK